MLKLKTDGRDTLRGILARVTSVIRLVRPVDTPPPPYTRCAGCGRGGRDDQSVPDPDQFNRPKAEVKRIGDLASVPAKAPDPIEVNVARLNIAPGLEAARLSEEEAKREKDGTAVKLIDAAPVWCRHCGSWYHAIRCYSLHRSD